MRKLKQVQIMESPNPPSNPPLDTEERKQVDTSLGKADKKVIKLRNIVDEENEEYNNKSRSKVHNHEFENLDQLDQWKEQLNTKRKVFVFDKSEPTQAKSMEFNFDADSGPQINQDILNQIARSDPRKKPARTVTEPDPAEQQVNVKFQMLRRNGESNLSQYKTLEQVRLDMNKKLLNTLLLDKVQRRVDKAQSGHPWTMNQIEEGTAQIFSEQARILKMSTLNNFKGLNEYFKNPAQFIDYEDVLAKAKHYSNKPVTFQQNNYVQSTTGHSTKTLMESYQNLQVQIGDHKTLLYGLRIDNNLLVGELQRKEEDIIQLKRKYYGREERTRQGMVEQNASSPGRRVTRNNVMDILERLRAQREQEETMHMLQIQQIRNQIQQNSEKQNLIQKELDELREKKRRCKMMLKDSFNKQLFKARQTLCIDSLVSIVKQLRKINEQPKQDHFPQYLDDTSVGFIFKVAALEQQVEEVRIQTQHGSHTLGNQYQLAALTQQYGSVSEIKEKVKAHLQTNRYVQKRVTTMSQDTSQPELLPFNTQTEPNEFSFKVSRVAGDPVSIQNKDLNSKLVTLQQQLEQMTTAEQNRLCKMYMLRRSESDAQELRHIYCALFGQNQGEAYWQTFMNQWCETYNINPQKLVNGGSQQVDQLQHASLPSIPAEVQRKVRTTMKSLVTEFQVDYDFDLLTLNSKPQTTKTRRRMIKVK